jgi:6-phosphogluconolactonase (cycloisomerase 2 family)
VNILKTLFCIIFAGVAIAQKPTIDFKARGIVALSDGDMVASARIDGVLMKELGLHDLLTAIPMPLSERTQEIGTTAVSNSVLGSYKSLAMSPNGRFAYVLESRQPHIDTLRKVENVYKNMTFGSRMYIVDIQNLAKPRVRFAVPTSREPVSCDVFQNQVVVLCHEPNKEIQWIEIDQIGHPTLTLTTSLNLPSNTKATDISFHPSGRFVVVLLDNASVLVYKIIRNIDNKRVTSFERFGKPLTIGQKLGMGIFTPDAKYFVVSNQKNTSTKSNLVVLTLNIADTLKAHQIVSQIDTDLNTESFAISPDGSTVVAANAKTSALAWNVPSISRTSSLSLITLSSSGLLSLISNYEFEGILPRNITFDRTGEHIAVSVFEYFNFGKRNGGIEFWKLNKNTTLSLSKLPERISVSRGCHALRLIP